MLNPDNKHHTVHALLKVKCKSETLTLSEQVFVEQQGGLARSLHLTGSRREVMRSSPKHSTLTEAFGVNASSRRGEHHPSLHEGQQFGKGAQTWGEVGVRGHI